ncbi:unnamed protein product [Mytilus coruscus]|uniref:Uncharacterized protein n=1 Tax=Mytilus coruscus TaxID=42192 RepID=A0A6J8BSK0_MYTCO|nr:unnamed protein product [Mytilus coruscus]
MHLEIERLKSEATPSYYKVKIDTEEPETSTEEMQDMFRVIEHGHIWEDKDKTIHNLRQKLNECSNTLRETITDLFILDNLTDHADELKEKDSIIHNMKQEMEEMKQRLDKCSQSGYLMNPGLTDHADGLKEKDSIIHNMKQEMEEMKQRLDKCSQSGYLMNLGFQPPDSNVAVPQLYPIYTPSIQPEECQDFEPSSVCDNCTEQGTTQLQHDIARLQEELQQSKQMIVKLESDAQTRQRDVDRLKQNLQFLSEELGQTKADQERNHGRNISVSNFYGPTNVMNGSSKDMALQLGNENWMRNLVENVQQSEN